MGGPARRSAPEPAHARTTASAVRHQAQDDPDRHYHASRLRTQGPPRRLVSLLRDTGAYAASREPVKRVQQVQQTHKTPGQGRFGSESFLCNTCATGGSRSGAIEPSLIGNLSRDVAHVLHSPIVVVKHVDLRKRPVVLDVARVSPVSGEAPKDSIVSDSRGDSFV